MNGETKVTREQQLKHCLAGLVKVLRLESTDTAEHLRRCPGGGPNRRGEPEDCPLCDAVCWAETLLDGESPHSG